MKVQALTWCSGCTFFEGEHISQLRSLMSSFCFCFAYYSQHVWLQLLASLFNFSSYSLRDGKVWDCSLSQMFHQEPRTWESVSLSTRFVVKLYSGVGSVCNEAFVTSMQYWYLGLTFPSVEEQTQRGKQAPPAYHVYRALHGSPSSQLGDSWSSWFRRPLSLHSIPKSPSSCTY
jgi:hypothetical protein